MDVDWDTVNYLEALKDCNLDKATVTRSFLQSIKEQGTEEEKKNAERLEGQVKENGTNPNFWLKHNNDFTKHEKVKVNNTSYLAMEYRFVALAIMFKQDPNEIIDSMNNRELKKKHRQYQRKGLDEKFNATKSSSELLPSTNVQQKSTIPNSNDVQTKDLEVDEEIKFDLVNVSMELNREPTVKISSSLRDTASKQLVGGDVFMDCGNAELNRMLALMFNNL
ncbi:17263_t:CDS:2 [Acaulospora colombiana]|uniref:17263_t:CDS:1 n=1 Tax=Acaulospora colombiana TaxID=27376 RepID=A0ACA9MN85_9GLOM|nr:17263_t:CDS:2 [Acaulospora colombiana]